MEWQYSGEERDMNRNARHIRLEVLVNGKRRCIAGVPEFGVLATIVDWVIRNPKRKPKSYSVQEWSTQRLQMHVGGFRDGASERSGAELGWVREDLKAGDEVTIRVLGPGRFDEPLRGAPNALAE